MLEDRYGNTISTTSTAARDAYVDGVDRFIAANAGVEDALNAAINADGSFALAHLALARFRQASGRVPDAAAPLAEARAIAGGTSDREAAQIEALALLIDGKASLAYPKIRAHVLDYPRDVMMAQTCTSVFGLIAFSGQPGREAEQLAYTAMLAPHYGEDWWFLSQHAFAQLEAGQIGPAADTIERSLALKPDSAHSVHVRAHLYYENGETEAGYNYLKDFWKGYEKTAQLHCHISWHIALWALARDDAETMWRVVDAHIAPGGAVGPALNVVTDTAAILYRAELHGLEVPADRWRALSAYASKCFPEPGVAFADVHAALAHAMAGDGEALTKIIRDARGPARETVRTLAEAFGCVAAGNWADATNHFGKAMAEHERIGGSRAQRDLIEYAMTGSLLRDGQTQEARRLLLMRRPHTSTSDAIAGLMN